MAENSKEPEKAQGPGEFVSVKQEKAGLESVVRAAKQAQKDGHPPVHLWNPPHCGDIGLRIGRDGTWYYQNSPIGRIALVKLFSTVLRKDPDEYVLVTPVEKISVEVEDAPFVAVEMRHTHDDGKASLSFRTNVDEWITAGSDHRLRFEETKDDAIKPYLHVRHDLWALVNRPVFYELVSHGITRQNEGRKMFGVMSADEFFAMARADELDLG